MDRFKNRIEAGRLLSPRLRSYAHRPDAIVLGLPRGGVPVAFEVAKALDVPMDVFLVRKLGLPSNPELAMGAIASLGTMILNREVIESYGIKEETLDEVIDAELAELQRREREYRGERPQTEISGRTIILVDDGLATGSTMLAAIAALRQQNPSRIVVAVPVGASETFEWLKREADETVCLATPPAFIAVGSWYEDFTPVTDAEVRDLLEKSVREQLT
jgi:putative phosphoribosyl transferase